MMLVRLLLSPLLLLRSVQSMQSISTGRCSVIINNSCLANELGLHTLYCDNAADKSDENSLVLYRNAQDDALELKWLNDTNKEKPYRIDFSSYLSKRMDTAKTELISRSIGKVDSQSYVIDFTAGIGRDSMTLAAAGHNVIMIERNPILFVLLNDALGRLKTEYSSISDRIHLLKYDSSTLAADKLSQLKLNDIQSDKLTVYLDPMYADDSGVGKKALVKKETQMLHRIVGSYEGNDEVNNSNLMNCAIDVATNRIVVKRALNAKPLCNFKAHHQIVGKTQRFDVYLKNQKIIKCQ